MPVKGRTSHERMLCKLLMEYTVYFATRTGGTAMPWADVHLYRKVPGGVWAECIALEVKSSVKRTKYLYRREKDQLDHYVCIAANYNIPIYYAFRLVTREVMVERKKWRFFDVRSIHDHTLKWKDGMTFERFLERL